MKHLVSLRTAISALVLAALFAVTLHAQQNETIRVQTFTYGSPYDASFLFPPDSLRFEKILMHYKLRCPFDGPCGEWDYLAYIYLYDKTGLIDSTRDTATNYSIGGQTPDSVSYMLRPSWRYIPYFQKSVVRTSTISFDSALVGTGAEPVSAPFPGNFRVGRSQYLWKAAELKAGGLKQGEITGIRLHVEQVGSELRNLMIRMKSSSLDSLTPGVIEEGGWTTVYLHDTRFASSGWNTIPFTAPFVWNNSSNIVVDVSFENQGAGGTATTVLGGIPGFQSAVASSNDDRSLEFQGRDYIEVPAEALAPVDSFVTVSFWQYGNPAVQPQEQSIFEAFDRFGRRVMNVHLPWGDTLVYWDAGSNNQGGFDRIIKKATKASEYLGQWNHWVFTKNARTGQMKMYLNGALWVSGTSKRRPITGIASFKIGSMGDGSRNYDGKIDEFAIWNVELDAATISAWVRGDILANHPFRDNLVLYYNFDQDNPTMVSDASGRGYHGTLIGPPQSIAIDGASINRGFAPVLRPNVIFEQGVYDSRIDSTLRIDSLPYAPMQIVRFDDPADPARPTDTLTVWPAYYRYTFNDAGVAVDSVLITPDATLRLERHPYYRKFEVVNRYEIGRYITPYGNGLNLGDGFVWTFDVTDYRTLLADSVRLVSINSQELVDIEFEMIAGVPPRDPIAVENLWVGAPAYGTSTPIENFLAPREVKIRPDAANVRLKMRSTGHGFGGTENCAEFCPKEHSILVDGTERFKRILWKDDCGLNPVYPQGGTWVYNRANWCPGDAVPTYDFELTPYVTPGGSATLDYNVQPYTWNGVGSTPYYAIETQLVSYSAPNFTLDASVEAIKSPSTADAYKRMNPICNNPLITIRNTGTTPLTSLKITYGVAGAQQSVHTWTGTLGFLESADVQLGAISWGSGEKTFVVTISEPNGGQDQYANNNTMSAAFTAPPVYPSGIILELRTNNNGYETSYELRNADGSLVFSRHDLQDATTYRDTLNLPDGCYEFRLLDEGGDGLDWWANRSSAGTGLMRIRRASNNAVIRTFGADFGSEIYQQFTVGYDLSSVEESPAPAGEEQVRIFPNPTPGEFSVDLRLGSSQDVTVAIRDMLGKTINERTVKNVTAQTLWFDISGQPPGVYVVAVQTKSGITSRKVVVR